jgi:hypothetical protein
MVDGLTPLIASQLANGQDSFRAFILIVFSTLTQFSAFVWFGNALRRLQISSCQRSNMAWR